MPGMNTGQGAHWPDIAEDISVRGMVEGRPASHGAEELRPGS